MLPFRTLVFALLSGLVFSAQTSPAQAVRAAKQPAESRTAQHFRQIADQPLLLREFLYAFPKGGDLHNHLSGGVYAESFIRWAAADGDCVDTSTWTIAPAAKTASGTPICANPAREVPAAKVQADPVLRRHVIDAFSLRNFKPAAQVGHYRFFDSFEKFGMVDVPPHTGEMLAEVAHRAALQNELYLELMITSDNVVSWKIADAVGTLDQNADKQAIANYREKLMRQGMQPALEASKRTLDEAEAQMRQVLHCGSKDEDPGCKVTIRYLFQVLRAQSPAHVMAHTLAGFEIAQHDPRVVGLNFVQPEDWLISMRDYDLHMRMLDVLHGIYPNVKISLHAGELAFGLVPPEELGQHIPKAIDQGHASRIGHGVDVMYYPKAGDLLKEMAKKQVAVEINLTSNDGILGVSGDQHPFPFYLNAGVPVVISTDDEGVNRSDMTHEYQRAVETYHLSYAQLKQISRNSLEFSFVQGASLWRNRDEKDMVRECAADSPAAAKASSACAQFLEKNPKARLQWELEQRFAEFESSH